MHSARLSSRVAIGAAAGPDMADDSAARLFAAGNSARRAGEIGTAIHTYNELQTRFAQSPEARLSHATLGRLLLDRGDAGAALRQFDTYLLGGDGALGEEALVGRALALEALGRSAEEMATWGQVLSRYPLSGYAQHAKARLARPGGP